AGIGNADVHGASAGAIFVIAERRVAVGAAGAAPSELAGADRARPRHFTGAMTIARGARALGVGHAARALEVRPGRALADPGAATHHAGLIGLAAHRGAC